MPSAAVGQGPEGAYVFVVDDNLIVSQRAVKIARVAGDRTVIADGIVAGTRVVIDGQSRVLPGQPVVDAAAAAPGADAGH